MGLRMGNTCPPMADSCQCMAKPPKYCKVIQFNSVAQSCPTVNPWTAAHQASLSITNSWSSPKSTSIKSVTPSNHLFLCRPLLLLPSIFPNITVFSNESVLRIWWRSIGVSASSSVLPKNIQDRFPFFFSSFIYFFTLQYCIGFAIH